jgi:peptide-methionine (S)-S-oxide reductase
VNVTTTSQRETAIFSAGCFWGVQELMRTVPGVIRTEVGYTGGTVDNPTYNDVKTGRSGHAEAVLVEYDPAKTSFRKLLELFFMLHDPTTLNRQGNDIGSQYRSAIFTQNEDQRKTALQVIDEVNKSGKWPKSVVTRIEPFQKFYSAEAAHQDYLQRNPGGYTCHFWRE